MKILVVSPHRDDAAFSLGLAISAWLQTGHLVEVRNCFTRSKYAPFVADQLLHPHDQLSHITALRQREDEAWRRKNGNGLSLTDLNLKDAPVRLRCEPDQVCTLQPVPGDKAMLKIEQAVAQRGAHLLILPLAVGHHVDHLYARDAALHAPLHAYAFYEDLPYSARPGGAGEIEQIVQQWHVPLSPTFAPHAMEGDAAAERKRQFALCYDSQVDEATTWQIADFSRRYGGRERLWANPAALSTGCLVAADSCPAGAGEQTPSSPVARGAAESVVPR